MLLREARKYGYGFLLAHQGLYQLSGALKSAFSANTSVKFAAGEEDSRELARQMRCDPGFIAHQPKLSFATFVKGQKPAAVSLQVPPGRIEAMPRMSDRSVCHRPRPHAREIRRTLSAVDGISGSDTASTREVGTT